METVVWKLRVTNLIRLAGMACLMIGAWHRLGVLIFDAPAVATAYRDVFAPLLLSSGGPIYLVEDTIMIGVGAAIAWFV